MLHDVAKQEAAYKQDRRGYRKLRLKKSKVVGDLAQSEEISKNMYAVKSTPVLPRLKLEKALAPSVLRPAGSRVMESPSKLPL